MVARLLFLDADARILELIRNGDEAGLTELYRSNRRAVRGFVTHNSGSVDDADDMLQEALVVLWERVRSGRFELAAKIDTFVFATVKNLWYRRLARMRHEHGAEVDPETSPDGNPSVLDDLIEDEEAGAVRDALDLLGDPCKSLLMLFYWEELTMDAIAQRLGFANAATAKSKKYQCKKALEELLRQTVRRGD